VSKIKNRVAASKLFIKNIGHMPNKKNIKFSFSLLENSGLKAGSILQEIPRSTSAILTSLLGSFRFQSFPASIAL
jgi:hypothetical protein